jgi:ankyrin repeat protein
MDGIYAVEDEDAMLFDSIQDEISDSDAQQGDTMIGRISESPDPLNPLLPTEKVVQYGAPKAEIHDQIDAKLLGTRQGLQVADGIVGEEPEMVVPKAEIHSGEPLGPLSDEGNSEGEVLDGIIGVEPEAVEAPRIVTAGTVAVDHSILIDKKQTDSSLVMGKDVIPVHKAIIQARNEHILTGLQSQKNKKGGFDYYIKDVKYPILKIVVNWLYSDKVDLVDIALSDVVKVIKAATHYQMDRLSQLCEQHLQASLTLENIWELLSLAHDQKVDSAKNLCMEFAFSHHDALLSDPRFRKWDIDLIVEENMLYTTHREQLEAGWLPPTVEVTAPSTIVEDFKSLYDWMMSGSDITIMAEKQNIKCQESPKELEESADASLPLEEDSSNEESAVNEEATSSEEETSNEQELPAPTEEAGDAFRPPTLRLFVFKDGDGFASGEILTSAPTSTSKILMLQSDSSDPMVGAGFSSLRNSILPAASSSSPSDSARDSTNSTATTSSASNRSTVRLSTISIATSSSSKSSKSSKRESQRWSIPQSLSGTDSVDESVDANSDPKARKGHSVVLRAASNGSLGLVKLHVRLFRTSVNARRGGSKQTPLHKAAANGHLKIMAYLIKHKANVNATDRNWRTPLHLAARKYQIPCIELLCERNAAIDAVDMFGLTPALLIVRDGWHELSDSTLGVLIEKGANLFAVDQQGRNLLHFAVGNNHITTVERLLNNADTRTRLCAQQDYEGNTPLHVSTAMLSQLTTIFDDSSLDIRERVLQALTAFPDVMSMVGKIPNHNHKTAYALATLSSKSLLRMAAQQHIEAECSNATGSCASLLDAIQLSHINCVKRAIKLVPNLNEPWQIHDKGGYGLCPVHVAVIFNQPKILKILIDPKLGGCNPNLRVLPRAKFFPSQTPVLIATNTNNIEALRILAKYGAEFDPNQISDSEISPLMIAIQRANTVLVEVLLDCGASATENPDNDPNAEVPLVVALKRPNALPDIVTALLNAGAPINEQRRGVAPIHLAVQHSDPAIALGLLTALVNAKNKKPNINSCSTSSQQTALQLAVIRQEMPLARLLLESGASTDVPKATGLSPLTTAVRNSHEALVDLLLSFNASVRLPNESPLLEAVKLNWFPTIDKLLKAGADPDQVLPNTEPVIFAAIRSRRLDVFYRLITGKANLLLPNEKGDHPLCLMMDLAEDDDTAVQWLVCLASALSNDSESDSSESEDDSEEEEEGEDQEEEGEEEAEEVEEDEEEEEEEEEENPIKIILDTPDSLDRTPLGIAVTRRLPNAISTLLSFCASANVLSVRGFTILQHALGLNDSTETDLVLAKELIDAGADVNITNNGLPLVYHATRTNQLEMLKLLLAAGTDVNLRAEPVTDSQVQPSETALCVAARVLPDEIAARYVHTLLNAQADASFATSNTQRTVLHWAVLTNKSKTLATLLNKNHKSKIPLDAKNAEGKTAAHHAIDQNLPNFLLAILRAGTSVTVDWQDPNSGIKPSTYIQYLLGKHLRAQDVLLPLLDILTTAGAPLNAPCAPQPLWLACSVADTDEEFAIKIAFRILKRTEHSSSSPCDVNSTSNREAETALIQTVLSNPKAIRLMRLLLKYGANPNVRCSKGYTALGAACLQPNPDPVKLLLSFKADPSLPGITSVEDMPVWIAAREAHLSILRLLLASATEATLNAIAPTHPKTCVTIAHMAAQYDDVNALHMLAQRKVDLLAVDSSRNTPLHYAMTANAPQAVSYLANRGGIKILTSMVNSKGQTPYEADVQRDSEIVQILASSAQKRLSVKCSCVSYVQSVMQGHLGCIKSVAPLLPLWMLENSDVPKDGSERAQSESLLITAIRYNRLGIATYLLNDLKLNVSSVRSSDGTSAIHHAAKVPGPPFIRLLIKSGANVNVVENSGRTPLMFAAEAGPSHVINVVELCKVKGIDIKKSDKQGCTALHMAALSGSIVAVSALLKAGASSMIMSKAQGSNGDTVLHMAARSGNKELMQMLLTRINPMNDLDVTNSQSRTCLAVAHRDCVGPIEQQVNMVKQLKANIKAETDSNAAKLSKHVVYLRGEVDKQMKQLGSEHRNLMQQRSEQLRKEMISFGHEVRQWAQSEAQRISASARADATRVMQQAQMAAAACNMQAQAHNMQAGNCEMMGDYFSGQNYRNAAAQAQNAARAAQMMGSNNANNIRRQAQQAAQSLPQQCRNKISARQNQVKQNLSSYGSDLAQKRAARSKQLQTWFRDELATEKTRLKGILDAAIKSLANQFKVSLNAVAKEAARQAASSAANESRSLKQIISQQQASLQERSRQEIKTRQANQQRLAAQAHDRAQARNAAMQQQAARRQQNMMQQRQRQQMMAQQRRAAMIQRQQYLLAQRQQREQERQQLAQQQHEREMQEMQQNELMSDLQQDQFEQNNFDFDAHDQQDQSEPFSFDYDAHDVNDIVDFAADNDLGSFDGGDMTDSADFEASIDGGAFDTMDSFDTSSSSFDSGIESFDADLGDMGSFDASVDVSDFDASSSFDTSFDDSSSFDASFDASLSFDTSFDSSFDASSSFDTSSSFDATSFDTSSFDVSSFDIPSFDMPAFDMPDMNVDVSMPDMSVDISIPDMSFDVPSFDIPAMDFGGDF